MCAWSSCRKRFGPKTRTCGLTPSRQSEFILAASMRWHWYRSSPMIHEGLFHIMRLSKNDTTTLVFLLRFAYC